MSRRGSTTDLARPLKRILDSPAAYRLGRWALAILFIYSGAGKLADVRGFAERVADFGIVPDPAVQASAVVLIVLELAAAVGLALDLSAGLILVCGLLVLFSGALAYGIVLGLEIDCGCFGLARRASGGGTLAGSLVRNLALLALCGYFYWFRTRGGSSPRDRHSATRRATDGRKTHEDRAPEN